MPGQTLLLTVTGRMVVSEHTHAYLYSDVPVRIPQRTCINTNNNGKVAAKKPFTQTRVGRKIHFCPIRAAGSRGCST